MTLTQLQNGFGPLAGGVSNWAGGYLGNPGPAPIFAGSGSGNEVPGSQTPAATRKGAVIVEGTYGSGEYDLAPAVTGGAEPYNCLAFALECDMDCWTQPGGGTSMGDIMEGHGYTPEEDFVGPRFQKVELSYNTGDGTIKDGNWSYAIKSKPLSCESSSKNRQGSLHTGITDTDTDTDAFREERYPPGPGPGQKTLVETYCR